MNPIHLQMPRSTATQKPEEVDQGYLRFPAAPFSISLMAWETLSPERYKILYARWISIRVSGERPFRLMPDDVDAVELGRVSLTRTYGGTSFVIMLWAPIMDVRANFGELVDATEDRRSSPYPR